MLVLVVCIRRLIWYMVAVIRLARVRDMFVLLIIENPPNRPGGLFTPAPKIRTFLVFAEPCGGFLLRFGNSTAACFTSGQ